MAKFCQDAEGSVRSHSLTPAKVGFFSFICRGGTFSSVSSTFHMCRATLSFRHASMLFKLRVYSEVERTQIKTKIIYTGYILFISMLLQHSVTCV